MKPLPLLLVPSVRDAVETAPLIAVGVVFVGFLWLALARLRRTRARKRKYPPPYRGRAIIMHVQRTDRTGAAGLPIYELHVAVEVPAHSPRYPVVLEMPLSPPYHQLLEPGTRVPVCVDPADRQRVELDIRARRGRGGLG